MGLLPSLRPPFAIAGLDQPLVVGALLLGLGALRASLLFTLGYTAGLAQEEASSRIREAAILRILPLRDEQRASAADAIFVYTELSGKAALFLMNVVRFLAAILMTVVLAAAMLYLSWMDCLIAIALFLVASVALLRVNVRIGRVAKDNPTIWNESVGAIESAGRNWFYIRIKHLHDLERHRLRQLNALVRAIGFRLRRLGEVSPTSVNVLAV